MYLWEKDVPGFEPAYGSFIPEITPYVLKDGNQHGAVIVCPGGAYCGRAGHEGAPIAKRFNDLGFSAFVLDYRVLPYRHPVPLLDAKRAIKLVRHFSGEWGIKPDRIGILGFSAGGHLASLAGTLFDNGNPFSEDPVEKESSRPDAMILCYPVITFGEYRNHGSMVNLVGENQELRSMLSSEKNVSIDTPPAFLFHTANDEGVPVENSLLFAEALSRHKIPFELHIFPEGRHGLGLASDFPHLAIWPELCARWLKTLGF